MYHVMYRKMRKLSLLSFLFVGSLDQLILAADMCCVLIQVGRQEKQEGLRAEHFSFKSEWNDTELIGFRTIE